jgi:SPP1 family predicted phage head-tail adaptor
MIHITFNTRAEIHTPVVTQDEAGGEVSTFALAASVPCRIWSLQGEEQSKLFLKETVFSTHKLAMLPNSVVTSKSRVVNGGRTFDVLYVDQKHGMTHHTELWMRLRE